ncbi:MAG: hypothetical protein ACOYZ6_13265 [Chloroflexota bacterium]
MNIDSKTTIQTDSKARRLVLTVSGLYLSLTLISLWFTFFQERTINVLLAILLIPILWGLFKYSGWVRRYILFIAAITILGIAASIIGPLLGLGYSTTQFVPISANWGLTILLLDLVVSAWLIYVLMRADVRSLFHN